MVSDWVILFPLPPIAPVILPIGTIKPAVQVKVAPAVVLLMAILVVPPVQIVWKAGEVEIVGVGKTVFELDVGELIFPFAFGVKLIAAIRRVRIKNLPCLRGSDVSLKR